MYYLSFVFLFLFVAACGYPEPPRSINDSKLEPFHPKRPGEIKSVEQAIAAIVTVCRNDLKLPIVEKFEALLYKNSQSFASYGLGWRMFPSDVSHVAAFANGAQIHIDLQKINDGSGWFNFTRVLAHEFGHTLQHEVMGVIPQTDPWFNEGFAEWVATKVLDVLGWHKYEIAIDRSKKDLARHLELVPHLTALRDNVNWHRTMTANYGQIRTYSLGLVAIDRLLGRLNLGSAIPLLSASIFNDALGGSYAEFDADLRAHLSGYKHKSDLFEAVYSPSWTIGDRWKHELRRPGYASSTEREFVRKDFFAGIPAYVLKSANEESFYSVESLSLLARRQDTKYSYRVSNNERRISWPLKPQKEWRTNFTHEDIEIGHPRTVRQLLRAVAMEDVLVKAGRFRSVKIESYGYGSGRLIAEFWYSPEVKWFVRSRLEYRDLGLVEEDLVSFRVQ